MSATGGGFTLHSKYLDRFQLVADGKSITLASADQNPNKVTIEALSTSRDCCQAMTDIATMAYIYHMIVIDNQSRTKADDDANAPDADVDGEEVAGGGFKLRNPFKKKTDEELEAEQEEAVEEEKRKENNKWLDSYVEAMKVVLEQLNYHAGVVINESKFKKLEMLLNWANGEKDLGKQREVLGTNITLHYTIVPEPSRDRSTGNVTLMVDKPNIFAEDGVVSRFLGGKLVTHVVWPADVIKAHLFGSVLKRFPYKQKIYKVKLEKATRSMGSSPAELQMISSVAQGSLMLLQAIASNGGGQLGGKNDNGKGALGHKGVFSKGAKYNDLLIAANAQILKPEDELATLDSLDEDERIAVSMFMSLYALYQRGMSWKVVGSGYLMPDDSNDMTPVFEGVFAATGCMVFATYHTKADTVYGNDPDRPIHTPYESAADDEHDSKNRVFVVKTKSTIIKKKGKDSWALSIPTGSVLKEMLPSVAIGIARNWIDEALGSQDDDDDDGEQKDNGTTEGEQKDNGTTEGEQEQNDDGKMSD